MKAKHLEPLPPVSGDSTPSETEETLDLGRVFAALRRKALLIFAITAAVATLAGVRAKQSPPTYVSEFEILIQPPSGEADVVSSVGGITQQPGPTSLSLEDQVKILTSPGILQPVVEQVLEEGWDICKAAQLAAEGAAQDSGVAVDPQEKCYKSIVSRLEISLTEVDRNAQPSRIFQTRFLGDLPQDVQHIANLISNRFLEYGLESRQRDIQQGIDFLDEKLPDVRNQVNLLQQELQTLRQNNDLITPDSRGSQLTSQINTYESEYLNTLVELEQTINLYDSLKQQLSSQPQDKAVSPVLSQNSRYQALIQELLQLDNEIAAASTLFLGASPDMQALQEQRQNLLQLLAREGANAQQELLLELEGLAQRESALRNTLSSLNGEVDGLASVSRQYADIERELTIATESLNQLQARRELLQIEAAQTELPWELISPPSISSFSASIPRNVAIGLALGLLLGIGVALALDAQRDVLYTPADLKRVTPVPLLGLVPYNEMVRRGYDEDHLRSLFNLTSNNLTEGEKPAGSNGLVPLNDMHAFKEAFRTLAANLQRVDTAKPMRSLVVSSVDEELLDSTTATYLAWAAAEMGHRVLLIDADLRFPHLHEPLGLPNKEGFSDALVGTKNLKQLIRRSPAEPNLFVLPAGILSTDPVKLLSTAKIRQFVTRVEPHFDLVIYHAPPFSEYADASLLAAEASGLALVSPLGSVKSAQLEDTLERLWVSKIPLVGIIAKEPSPKASLLPI
jgi:capsular exopolysaccharide synthesis family protein